MPALQTQAGPGAFQASSLAALNQLSNMIFPTQGNVWWVRPFTGDDINNSGQSPLSAFKTLPRALAAATANQNDIVYLCAESNTASRTTDYQASNLDWNKDMVHLIGVNGGPFLGQRSRIAPVATATAFANLFTVSANGCQIANSEFFQGQMATNPSAASTCVTVSGQRNTFKNCQISGVGHADLDDTGSNDLTVTGSENLFKDCYIGLNTIIRGSALAGVVLSGSNARNTFADCHFDCYTSSTSYKFISVATGTDRFVLLVRPRFSATPNITSSAAPSGAIGITTMNGQVMCEEPKLYNVTQITTADNSYVQVLGLNGLATGHLIGIAQGVDAA